MTGKGKRKICRVLAVTLCCLCVDSVIIEEAAQILEIETIIPLLLQESDPVTHASRLKRAVLLGDAQQLPPVIQHQTLAKVCRLEQSLFSRVLRLGVPSVTLDQQGRARPELAALYAWKYTFPSADGVRELGDLPAVLQHSAFLAGNAGFAHTFQFIDVSAFNNKGENCPTPHFYQNLGEAEYVVAVYQYMRLLGYPASKISIITSYNGQKHLIRDILQQRCKNASMFGYPAQVTTVDKYQGQQNDYVLLSLVRTESVGHIRDLRRLVVALSRARLGLYVFGRLSLFENCFELMPAFSRLKQHPVTLRLVAGESYPCQRPQNAIVPAGSTLEVADVTSMGILVYQMVQQAQQLIATQPGP
jgi:intron-binding protein aquarius